MKQLQNILMVTPINKQLISQAARLLYTSQSRLTLLAIAPELENPQVQLDSGKTVDLQKLLETDLKGELDETARILANEAFRVRTAVRHGQPSIEVIRQVIARNHDLVLMTADGVCTLREQLFGTLSLHLIRKCPSPVWIVKPSRRRLLRNVFAAVDPDPDNATRDLLNVEILRRAQTIAQSENAQLHIVHAWNSLGNFSGRSHRWMNKSELRLYAERLADLHRRRLQELVARETDGSTVVHMVQGRPGTVIPEVVAKHAGDLLVMGTVCRTGIPGLFIGNTAEMILSQVDCSVLTVKPAEFQSPVKPAADAVSALV